MPLMMLLQTQRLPGPSENRDILISRVKWVQNFELEGRSNSTDNQVTFLGGFEGIGCNYFLLMLYAMHVEVGWCVNQPQF